MRARLAGAIDDALRRLPREPNLHAKRDLGRRALEDAQALVGREAGDETAMALHARRVAQRPAPALVFFQTDAIPARDPYVEIGPGPPSAVNDALILAEAAATTALEAPTWAAKLALIEVVATQLDRTAALEADEPWGAQPVDTSGYDRLMALPLGDRVEQLLREGARRDEDPAL